MTAGRTEHPWTNSYDEGVAQQLPIPEATYVDLLNQSFVMKPRRTALRYMGTAIRFRELDELSLKFAGFLKEKGLGPGDVVGINLPNIPEYPIALAGALRAGCSVTGISPLLTAKEMEYQINDSGASAVVIMDTLFEERLLKVKEKVPGLKHIIAANVGTYLPAVKRILGSLLKKIPKGSIIPIAGKEVLSFTQALNGQVPLSSEVKITPDDTCLIQYTGGTTGMPKGTILTHANLVANHTHAREWVKFEMGEDVLCSGFPYFHLAGLAFGMLAMATANTQCLIPDPRNTKHICKEISNYKSTIIAMVPTLYQMLLDDPAFKTIDFSPLKICISGAAPFSVDGINEMEEVVGRGKVLEVYGMTEASPLLTMNPFYGKKKIGSVGIPIQNTIIKLVDLETRETEVGFNEEGEIIASGPQIMKGYHNKPEETEQAIREYNGGKYFFTGDIGKMDEDGYITIVDRAKDMLIVGGYKVFSREVEETLYEHPDVEFCAIVGVPDENRPGSEIVKAVIQPSSEAKTKDKNQLKQDIIAFCRENKAPYKVPKIVEVVDEIPLTAVGKVDKKALR